MTVKGEKVLNVFSPNAKVYTYEKEFTLRNVQFICF